MHTHVFLRIHLGEFGIVCRGQILDKRRLSEVAGTGVEAFAGVVAVKTLKGNRSSLVVPSYQAVEIPYSPK